MQAISVGYGATYFLAINQEDVESCPQKDRNIQKPSYLGRCRRAKYLPKQLKLLRDPSYDWRLEAGEDGNTWTLYRLANGDKVESFVLRRAEGY